ncbi:SLBB domain-containing protein [Polynucleobacter sp. MWH-Loch1C5]|uniref:SLBB domain-containing protein n=1 Tax=Polynucleobacter sp. MWH-Loch1C5 TaxID=2689108 RepID=UPI001C0B39BE|nr:SLBB domain-containing protein [Polynucleobacter sp. MWH-Loch1C5]MBU3542220.1 SLBB domain-containing protein [Polynucleobacter sp. MWH-Loch1C5]
MSRLVRFSLRQLIASITAGSLLMSSTMGVAQTTFLSQLQTQSPPAGSNPNLANAQQLTPEQIAAIQARGGNPNQPTMPGAYVQQKPIFPAQPPRPTEFEIYVSNMVGEQLTRYGSELMKDGEHTFSPSSTAAVPNDYVIAIGDEIFVRVWGSVDADLRLIVDRQGQITIPKVGAIVVAGVPHGKLSGTIQAAIGKTYSGANVAASIGQMRGIRVYVTGYALVPGAYTVNNLSSLVNVVMAAGGPSAAGSYRDIQLKRNGKVISQFDLYDLLLKGDKSQDRAVTAEDVIHVGPAGAQVAVVGAVNKPSIFEIKKGETLQDALKYSGGFLSGAQTDAINFMGLNGRRDGFKTLPQAAFASKLLEDGDIYMATSGVAMKQPADKQMRMIKVDGQVNKPGVYVLKAGSTLQDAIQAAGGLSDSAYLYGSRLERVTVRTTQEENLKRFIREFKRDVEGAASVKTTTAEDAALGKARQEQGQTLLRSLQELKPDGRMALSMKPQAKKLPDILVESGDVLTIPMKPNSVTVLGSINGGQVGIAYNNNKSVRDYIQLAGGYSRGADQRNVYVMRASGEFVSASGWFSGTGSIEVMPGDAIFVPENLQKTTFTKELRDWTAIIYQLGLGAAAIKVLRD